MEPQRFVYYLKLWDGKLIYSEGTDMMDAAHNIGISLASVKRAMPVRRVLTEVEKLERKEIFKKLREQYGKARNT
jgi:hypothetical protein